MMDTFQGLPRGLLRAGLLLRPEFRAQLSDLLQLQVSEHHLPEGRGGSGARQLPKRTYPSSSSWESQSLKATGCTEGFVNFWVGPSVLTAKRGVARLRSSISMKVSDLPEGSDTSEHPYLQLEPHSQLFLLVIVPQQISTNQAR